MCIDMRKNSNNIIQIYIVKKIIVQSFSILLHHIMLEPIFPDLNIGL
jgi:hypothetical protein